MEEEQKTPKEQILDFARKNALFVILIFIGFFLVVFGVFQYLGQKGDDIQIVSGSSVDGAQASNQKISIDVEGSVLKPGVYILPEGARLQDALIAAGGISSDADREYVAKNLNLAQKLSDAAKIYVPKIGEKPTTSLSVGVTTSTDVSNLININSATAADLDKLPKVGAVTAQKIIDGRPYSTIDELVSKKVLTQKTFDGLKGMIVAE